MSDLENPNAPNYANARGKAAARANRQKDDHDNPDSNPGHLQESSRPSQDAVGGWKKDVERPLVVNPVDTGPDKPVIEPHGIKRI